MGGGIFFEKKAPTLFRVGDVIRLLTFYNLHRSCFKVIFDILKAILKFYMRFKWFRASKVSNSERKIVFVFCNE